ncbi:MAG: DUF1127 domain-containing protein [Pseudomonadota bacterium]
MAAIDTTRPIVASRGASQPTFFAKVIGAIAEWNDRRVTRKALSQLSARELDDIGLTPGDVAKF